MEGKEENCFSNEKNEGKDMTKCGGRQPGGGDEGLIEI